MKAISTQSLAIGSFFYEKINPVVPAFPVIAEKDVPQPFATFRRSSLSGRSTKDRYNYEETATMEVYITASDYPEGVRLARAVKDTLEGYRGPWRDSFISDVTLTGADEDWHEYGFIQRLYFSVTIDNSLIKS